MTSIDTVVIGAGHAGLSVSRLLTRAGFPHVVLDRGRVGERWRSERWDSLHLLTPNWMTRLPGRWYRGPDPDGFMSATDFVGLLDRYAGTLDVPVLTGTSVLEVSASGDGYRVVTDQGTWRARQGGRRDRPAREALRAAGAADDRGADREPLSQPGAARPRGRARGRRLGVRRPDRRRAGPGRPGGGARGGPAHPAAAQLPRAGRLLVVGDHGPPGPHHRLRARPGGGSPRDVAAAGRAQPPDAPGTGTSTSAPCRRAASGSPATWTRSRGTSPGSATTWPARFGPPTGPCTGSSTRSTGASSRPD